MATSSITTSSSVDAYGNSYTTSVSSEGLQSEDFLTLMLTELSMQDPTNPVDSASMLDTQLQLSTLEANLATVEAMESLQTSFQQSALSSASSMIGSIIETSDLDDEGNAKQY
ncbi:MAG: flagellar hook capping FlgD N-terminal domain-containing protein, partial [Arcobacteraceae bacterium]